MFFKFQLLIYYKYFFDIFAKMCVSSCSCPMMTSSCGCWLRHGSATIATTNTTTSFITTTTTVSFQVFLPNDDQFTWILAKMWFNNADANVHQALCHFGWF